MLEVELELEDRDGGMGDEGGDGGGEEHRGGLKKGEPSKEAVSGVCTEDPSVSVLALSRSPSASPSSSSENGGGSSTSVAFGVTFPSGTTPAPVPRVAHVSDCALLDRGIAFVLP